jgi:hypothetical protein
VDELSGKKAALPFETADLPICWRLAATVFMLQTLRHR